MAKGVMGDIKGEGLGRCGHEERDKSNCWCLLLSLCGDCACRLEAEGMGYCALLP